MHRVLAALTLLVVPGVFLNSPEANATTRPVESPAQLITDASVAFGKATSVRAIYDAGGLSSSGKPSAATFSLNAEFFSGGDIDGAANIDGYSNGLIVIGKNAYMLSTAEYYEHVLHLSKTTANHLANYWIVGPNSASSGSSNSKGYAVGTNLSFHALDQMLFQHYGHWVQVGTSDYEGLRTDELKTALGATLWVAASAPHYPADFNLDSAGKYINVYLLNWNLARRPSVPTPVKPISAIP